MQEKKALSSRGRGRLRGFLEKKNKIKKIILELYWVKIKTLEQKVGGMERSSGIREELKHVPTAVSLFGCEGATREKPRGSPVIAR